MHCLTFPLQPMVSMHYMTVCDMLHMWLAIIAPGLTLDVCTTAEKESLIHNHTLSTLIQPHYSQWHLDFGKLATKKYIIHTCLSCTTTFKILPVVQSNPLAIYRYTLHSGELFFVRLPTMPKPLPVAPESVLSILQSIVVEPLFLPYLLIAQFNKINVEV